MGLKLAKSIRYRLNSLVTQPLGLGAAFKAYARRGGGVGGPEGGLAYPSRCNPVTGGGGGAGIIAKSWRAGDGAGGGGGGA